VAGGFRAHATNSRPIAHRVGYRIAGAATVQRHGRSKHQVRRHRVRTDVLPGGHRHRHRGTFASADLYWSVPRASRPQWMSMTMSGTTAHARVDRIAGTTVTWWVNAVSDTGEKVSTGMTATTVDCPAGG
jgi:hypothetical protein